jgi:soluble P-type ATPase
LAILSPVAQDRAKLDYVERLGVQQVVSIGNGCNDRLMLQRSALGIAVVLEEGAFPATLVAADVVCTSIQAAIGLLTHPLRLKATLRV